MPHILLHYPGIKGDSSFNKYQDLIVCESFQFSSDKRDIGTHEAAADDPFEHSYGLNSLFDPPPPSHNSGLKKRKKPPAPKKPGCDGIKLVRRLDIASAALMQAGFAAPVSGQTAKIYLFRAFNSPLEEGGKTLFADPYVTFELENVQISEYGLSIDGDQSDGSTEDITLYFEKLKMTFVQHTDGKKVGNYVGSVSLTNKE